MTTPYCTKDQWAQRHGYADWSAFAALESYPDATQLQNILEDATEIMNDTEHIGCLSSNITDSDYTARLERICFNMANRMLDEMNARGAMGGKMFTNGVMNWSQADYLMSHERAFLVRLSLVKGYRQIGGFGTG